MMFCLLADVEFLGQTFNWHDLAIVGLLVVLEGVLSIDNALVLGLLAKRLPKSQQSRALTYGLVGAFVFRLIAIATAGFLFKWRIVKLVGGGYLVYIAIRHLFFDTGDEEEIHVSADQSPELRDARTGELISPQQEQQEIEERVPLDFASRKRGGKAAFWPTVLVIELTDIAFAVDSILAAIALVGSAPADHPQDALHPKLWVVLVGGMLGVVLMRFAAVIFIRVLERFPRFAKVAYLLVIIIGGKLLADWYFNTPDHPHRVDFHDWHNPAFSIFWGLMVVCFCAGFIPKRTRPEGNAPAR